jgi:tRNA A37 threonylcarbamoyladenosine dehydratase
MTVSDLERARRDRLAAALRDNLRRRKAQARADHAEQPPQPGSGRDGQSDRN